jgi:alkyl sulfatase BDS1-like metallo-beta-lactamase superfamily hydrolase
MVESANAITAKGLKVASMVQSGNSQAEAVDRGNGIYENQGIGNSYLITTSEGNVLVNAGALKDARRGKKLFARISSQPICHIVLTQSHANQFGGLEIYKTAENQVIAHRNYPEERQYTEALSAHYRRGSRRIFARMTGATEEIMPTREVSPDLLIDEFHAFELGGRRFEIHWTPGGETRSAVIVWLPLERVAIAGNLFGPLFGNHPNLNTMRGDKPRRALQFIASVKKLRELSPVQILTGHEDIRGEEFIQTELTRIIETVQWVHDKTIEGMNAGIDLRTLMREIKTPSELTLTEEYGKLSWNVRAIWHEYTGWFDPSRGTTELYGVPPSSVAPTLVELTGGTESIVVKARDFLQSQKPLEALHLLDIVLAAEPDLPSGREAKKEALNQLLEQTGGNNLWERMWIDAAIRDTQS